VCAFADDLLKETFKTVLPNGVPGGKKNMLGGYGPLSDLAKRIQLAYAFDVFSQDLMLDLDRVRTARNAIAHSWDIDQLGDILGHGRLADIHPVEELLAEREIITKEFAKRLAPLTAFRIRLI
jgi:DNA-binding MltR family transcriptional regulator